MSTYLLQNGVLLTLTPPIVEQADLRIVDGRIVAKAKTLSPVPDETVVDLAGKIVMPGLVCAHTHLYSTLARGMPGPAQTPRNFPEILEYVWWTLDRALDEASLYFSTLIGVLEAIASGTTTIFDHHASPGCIHGSLQTVQAVFEEVGVRGVLCYEVTDRGGRAKRDAGLAENRWLLEHQTDLVKGLVGAHAAFTLSDDSLRRCADLIAEYDSGLHIHLAEDACDVRAAQEHHGRGLVDRLCDAGVLNAKSVLAHGVHLTAAELRQLEQLGCWLVHNPRSNMNNAVGYAPVAEFGERNALGTDGITANLFEEVKFAYFKAQESGNGVGIGACLGMLAGGQRLASAMFDQPIGPLEPGAAADLLVLEYPAPTPLHADNLAGHLIFGLSRAHIESVMIAGRFVFSQRRFVHPEAAALYRKAQAAAQSLWQRMAAAPSVVSEMV